MKFIVTESSKKRNAPYTPGVIHGGILYISGQLALDPETGKVPEGGVREHARPARVVVPTGPLHYGSLVEIEAVAAVMEVS